MNLSKLFELQKVLDERIIREKGLEGQDLLPMKILALQVELGELANEWRGFKHWSDRREPKHGYSALIDCDKCGGRGFWFAGERVWCTKCNHTGKITNPLLEEYVDCLHFILSIGLDKGHRANDNLCGLKYTDVIYQFNEVFKMVSRYQNSTIVPNYIMIWAHFIPLGELLGFTWEQVEQAYRAKNAENHARQDRGY